MCAVAASFCQPRLNTDALNVISWAFRRSSAPHLQQQLSRTSKIIRANIAINQNLEAQLGALDPSPVAGEHSECPFFSGGLRVAVVCWSFRSNTCQHGSRQRVPLHIWASGCGLFDFDRLTRVSAAAKRRLCDIPPQLGRHLAHVVLGQWRLRWLAYNKWTTL